jgi:NADPH:quinone reductase-like Zn-dependent oxidoreductase
MKAAIVFEAGRTPVYGDFAEPVVGDGEVRVHVTAAALSNLAKGRVSGTHYSASVEVPFVVGVDGVGRLDDGRRVYFILPKPPLGSMSERAVVREEQCIALPDELDDVTAAAIANPGMSGWAALAERAKFVSGETVLVNGATGMAGRVAVQIAKYMGAKKIIATGRNVAVLESLKLIGADVTIPLTEDGDALEEAFRSQFVDGIDVVLDYLYGQSAERLLVEGAKAGASLRFVQIGSMSGPDIKLPGSILRSAPITLMGSGLGSVPNDRLARCISDLMQAAVPGGFEIATHTIPLSEVEETWSTAPMTPRTVYLVG